MARAVIIANQVPGRDFGFEMAGHGIYLAGIIDFLKSRGYDVTLLVFRPTVNFFATRSATLPARVVGPDFTTVGNWTVVHDVAASMKLAAWNVYKHIPRGWQARIDDMRKRRRLKAGAVHNFGSFITEEETAFATAFIAHESPDLVLYDSVYNTCAQLSSAPHWVITHEIKHQRMESFRDHGLADGSNMLTAETESRRLGAVGNLIAIQWDDATALRELVPSAQVVVAPVTMPRAPLVAKAERPKPSCVFIGSGSYHNLDGIAWFLNECWPLVRAARPDATLDIFGTVCYRLGEVPAGVRLGGVVADLTSAYAGAAVTIVPLRVGSGLKVKLAEALSLGEAVVTTSVGAQGLIAVEPRPFALADSAVDFADAIIRLFSSHADREALRQAAWTFSTVFDKTEAFKEFDDALRCMTGH